MNITLASMSSQGTCESNRDRSGDIVGGARRLFCGV